ncbi:MAG: hypothetical protein V2J02_01545 [Pseudomonadales bacterium]|nr:hypothetical protein [Pseudomonadales bacterium]
MAQFEICDGEGADERVRVLLERRVPLETVLLVPELRLFLPKVGVSSIPKGQTVLSLGQRPALRAALLHRVAAVPDRLLGLPGTGEGHLRERAEAYLSAATADDRV